MNDDIIGLLAANVQAAYVSNLRGGEEGIARHAWFSSPKLGDLVMETSTIWMPSRDPHRFGYLVSNEYEPRHTDEEWERIKDDYDGVRPTERAYRIKLLTDGSEYCWVNASFIRVPRSVREFYDITRKG